MRVGRWIHGLYVLVLAAFVVVPALPRHVGHEATVRMGAALRKISVSQNWRMYVPNPQRSHAYMNLTARFPDGSSLELEETEQERRGWGGIWDFEKTRLDIWRYYANLRPKEPNRNRDHYLRGVCVREARRHAIPPYAIEMTQVRRSFTPPDRVRSGKPALSAPSRFEVQTMSCRSAVVLRMIEEDRRLRAARE